MVGGGGDRSGRWQYSLVLRLGRVGGHGRTARCERGGAYNEARLRRSMGSTVGRGAEEEGSDAGAMDRAWIGERERR